MIWRDVKGTDVFPKSALDGPWAFFQKRASVHSNSGLRAIIEAGIDFENLEDTTIPFEVVTTSLTDGRERWLAHGNAVEAILASSAIPSILPPVVIDGDVLIDGGVVNNVPISRAMLAGCTRIYVLLCGPLHYRPPVPRRPVEAALTAFFVAMHARFMRELAMLPPGVEVVVFSGGGEPSAQYRDFSATAGLVEEGRAEVAEVLDRYAGTSQDLSPHRPPPPAPAAPPPPRGPHPRCPQPRPPHPLPPRPRPLRPGARPPHPDRSAPPARPGRAPRPVTCRRMGDDRYLLPNAEEAAAERFAAFTELFDPSTFAHMDRLGLAARLAVLGGGGRWRLGGPVAGRKGGHRGSRAGHRHRRDPDQGGRGSGQPARRGARPRCRPRPSPRRPVRPRPRPPGPGARTRSGRGR